MYRIMNGIIALSQAMELGRYTNEAAKPVNSKGLFAGLDLTGSRLWDTDAGFQAIPTSTPIMSILCFVRLDGFSSSRKRRECLDLLILTAVLSSPVKASGTGRKRLLQIAVVGNVLFVTVRS